MDDAANKVFQQPQEAVVDAQGFPGGPHDTLVLTGYVDHVASFWFVPTIAFFETYSHESARHSSYFKEKHDLCTLFIFNNSNNYIFFPTTTSECLI